MSIVSFFIYSLVIFYLGMRHERAQFIDTVTGKLFTPHRPRLLVSPHWPHREMRSHTGVVGAGLSQPNQDN